MVPRRSEAYIDRKWYREGPFREKKLWCPCKDLSNPQDEKESDVRKCLTQKRQVRTFKTHMKRDPERDDFAFDPNLTDGMHKSFRDWLITASYLRLHELCLNQVGTGLTSCRNSWMRINWNPSGQETSRFIAEGGTSTEFQMSDETTTDFNAWVYVLALFCLCWR